MQNGPANQRGPKGPLTPEQIEERIQELLSSGKITEDQVDEVREKMQNFKLKLHNRQGSNSYNNSQVSTQLT